MNLTRLIIILNINCLDASIKRHRLSDGIKNNYPLFSAYRKSTSNIKTQISKSKRMLIPKEIWGRYIKIRQSIFQSKEYYQV